MVPSLSCSTGFGLTAFDEYVKLVAADDPNLKLLDEGTQMNICDGHRFIYGR